MERLAFQLRLRPGVAEEYDELHRRVWPELLDELASFGVSEYSIFRSGDQLFLYMKVQHPGSLEGRLAASEINLRWQKQTSRLFESSPGLDRGEMLPTMREVFYMAGKAPQTGAPTSGEGR